MGGDIVLNPSEIEKSGKTIESVIMKETKKQGADFFLETAGVPDITTPIMLNTLNVNGRIVQTARSSESTPIYLEKLQVRAAQIFGAQGHSGNGTFQNVIRLIEAGMIHPEKIITSKYSLDNGIEAFERAKKRVDAKIVINP
jgi:threonine dehydrogenase-like Zn-dependent dehydrogenase